MFVNMEPRIQRKNQRGVYYSSSSWSYTEKVYWHTKGNFHIHLNLLYLILRVHKVFCEFWWFSKIKYPGKKLIDLLRNINTREKLSQEAPSVNDRTKQENLHQW